MKGEIPIPQEYQSWREACQWDCAIELLPQSILPKGKVYPLLLPESKAMDDYIEEVLAAGYISPSTSSEAAGFFFVEKTDCGLRPCIYYRGLNAITAHYPYPLPLVPAALEQLRKAKIFKNLDLRMPTTWLEPVREMNGRLYSILWKDIMNISSCRMASPMSWQSSSRL